MYASINDINDMYLYIFISGTAINTSNNILILFIDRVNSRYINLINQVLLELAPIKLIINIFNNTSVGNVLSGSLLYY